MLEQMNSPQLFQYQGSKRGLAPKILRYLPAGPFRVVEPFAGSAAISIAAAIQGIAHSFWLNDVNRPLADLVELIIDRPEEVADRYEDLWSGGGTENPHHYNHVRDEFNRTKNPALLLYLLARCVKGAVRYNSSGLFNQSPDKRRLGTRPQVVRERMRFVSSLLRGRTRVSSLDYRDVLSESVATDVVYMDPPYQGVCGDRDSRYASGISFGDFVDSLRMLNSKDARYLISYDGSTGSIRYGQVLPSDLELERVELRAGRSTQATLLGRDEETIESLYMSRALVVELEANGLPLVEERSKQIRLFDSSVQSAEVS